MNCYYQFYSLSASAGNPLRRLKYFENLTDFMPKSFYLDSCIWRDYYENRFGQKGKPIGRFALHFLTKIIEKKEIIFFSELIIKELKAYLLDDNINEMFRILFHSNILHKINIDDEDYKKAKEWALLRDIPASDAAHAIMAGKNDAILVTRDNHFEKLKDIVEVKKPEEIYSQPFSFTNS